MAKHLTPKQELFCNVYLETGNASEAYRRAYNCSMMKPETINVKAIELLQNGKIAVRLAEMQKELKKASDITKERVLTELSAIAFADIRDYVKFDGTTLTFKSFDELTGSQAKVIESIKKKKDGSIELRFHGKSWSLERICKILGFDSPKDLRLMLERLDESQLDQIINQIIDKNE